MLDGQKSFMESVFCRSFTPPSTLYRSFRRRASTLPVRANPGCEGLNVPAEKSRKIRPTRASNPRLLRATAKRLAVAPQTPVVLSWQKRNN